MRRDRLLLSPSFGYLWAAQTVSMLGTQVTVVALPLTAVIALEASAAEVGLLSAMQFVPVLLLTLPAGVLVDRWPRRPTIIATHVVRAGLLGSVPVLAGTGMLDVWLLLFIAFGIGAMTALFDVAHLAFVPSVVAAEQVMPANSRLLSSWSSAQMLGPGLGGVAVAAVGAPAALLLDAGAYLCAAALVTRIRAAELVARRRAGTGRPERFADALSFTFGNGLIRTMVVHASWFNLFETTILTLYPLYALRQLGLGPAALGTALSVGGGGAIIGAVLSQWLTRAVGLGRALSAGMALASGALLLVPLADVVPAAYPVLCAALFAHGLGLSVYNVQAVSMRQLITPDTLMGRATACYRLVSYGTMPLGAAGGGLLAAWIGVSPALWVAGVALVLAAGVLSRTRLARSTSADDVRIG